MPDLVVGDGPRALALRRELLLELRDARREARQHAPALGAQIERDLVQQPRDEEALLAEVLGALDDADCPDCDIPLVLHPQLWLIPTWFPFDDQNCDMKFGSWTYNGFNVCIFVFIVDRMVGVENQALSITHLSHGKAKHNRQP